MASRVISVWTCLVSGTLQAFGAHNNCSRHMSFLPVAPRAAPTFLPVPLHYLISPVSDCVCHKCLPRLKAFSILRLYQLATSPSLFLPSYRPDLLAPPLPRPALLRLPRPLSRSAGAGRSRRGQSSLYSHPSRFGQLLLLSVHPSAQPYS